MVCISVETKDLRHEHEKEKYGLWVKDMCLVKLNLKKIVTIKKIFHKKFLYPLSKNCSATHILTATVMAAILKRNLCSRRCHSVNAYRLPLKPT